MLEPEKPRSFASSAVAESSPSARHSWLNEFFKCLMVGTVSGGVFHVWDLALLRAFMNKRKVLHLSNFINPSQGLGQTLMTKPITGSVYFFMQTLLKELVYPPLVKAYKLPESFAQIIVGGTAGAVDGAVRNIFTSIKYVSLANPGLGFFPTIRMMWNKGGLWPFVRGTRVNAMRDSLFGGIYEFTRAGSHKWLQNKVSEPGVSLSNTTALILRLGSDGFAAGAGTLGCSAFHYANREIKSTPLGAKPPSFFQCMTKLAQEAAAKPKHLEKFLHVKTALGVGPLTLRITVGMTVNQQMLFYAPAAAKTLTKTLGARFGAMLEEVEGEREFVI